MNSKLQQKLWVLANYDYFFLKYCPALYNKIAGIGMYFIFQIIIVFFSILIAYSVFIPEYFFLGWLISILGTFIFYKWIKFFNNIYQNYNNIGVFILQTFFNLILALLLCIPFCLYLFEQQILFRLFQDTGKMNFEILEKLWMKPYTLYNTLFSENEGTIILLACLAVFILIAFVFIAPYLLIYNNRKSSYNLVKKNYEQNFYA